ncbi:MAG: ferric reductase-like transmembrane domain-containing protein [Gemmatimonadaceae bacterium]|nr:ferric reductase-like transmembrane domain-containing protein [Gemmatimonadaceae bacterium]
MPNAIDLSSFAGLGAITLLTLNILIGLLLSTKYNPVRRWPHRRLNTVKVHNWTGYLALLLAAVHPALILFSASEHFTLLNILYPLNAPKQPGINTFGAAALYILTFTVITSYFRFQIGRRWWKKMHFLTYAMFPLYAVHGILTDPTLKNAPLDPFDAEKVYVELCVLLVAVAVIARVRWQLRQPPPRVHRPRVATRAAAPLI